MIGRLVEVCIDEKWYPGWVKSVETGPRGNSMEVTLMPSRKRILPAYAVVAPETEGTLWNFKGEVTRPDNGFVSTAPLLGGDR